MTDPTDSACILTQISKQYKFGKRRGELRLRQIQDKENLLAKWLSIERYLRLGHILTSTIKMGEFCIYYKPLLAFKTQDLANFVSE